MTMQVTLGEENMQVQWLVDREEHPWRERSFDVYVYVCIPIWIKISWANQI
jgi:hypothetical protein